MDNETLESIISFIEQVGIPVKKTTLLEATFVPGIKIHCGELLVDQKNLKQPGDLLHEAGHIAVMTPNERKEIKGDISLYRPPGVDDELAAILWSYAALTVLNLPANVVFHQDGYKGDSDWLIEQFEAGIYIGLHLLVWMELCDELEYPKMKHWLRGKSD